MADCPVPLDMLRVQPCSEAAEEVDSGEDSLDRARDRLVCAVCHALVTYTSFAVTRDGKHEHTFFNPSGLLYHLGCFSGAPGAAGRGGLCDEFPWFTGYSWEVAVCKECGEHLGWRFVSRPDSFYGLILSRLKRST